MTNEHCIPGDWAARAARIAAAEVAPALDRQIAVLTELRRGAGTSPARQGRRGITLAQVTLPQVRDGGRIPARACGGSRTAGRAAPGHRIGAEARRVASRLPGAQVLIVPNQGHSVIGQAACADGVMRRFMTGQPVGRAGTGLAHGFVLASWFRKAASPASDTSTHFLSGTASAT